MPNIKSAKKQVRNSEKKRQVNLARRSAIKTAIKKVLVALEQKDVAQAKTFLVDAESKIARAKGKGLLHRNTAARKISRLALRVSKVEKGARCLDCSSVIFLSSGGEVIFANCYEQHTA